MRERIFIGACVANLALFGLLFLTGIITTDMPAASVSAVPYHVCKTIEVPADDEEFYTIDWAPANITLTKIYCEVTNGTSVVFDFEIDDDTPTGVNGSGITCTTSGVTDSTLGGDTDYNAGDRLDIDLGAVTGAVDLFTACAEGTIDLGG